MKFEANTRAVQSVVNEAKVSAGGASRGKPCAESSRELGTQAEQASVLDACRKSRSPKLKMIGPCN